VWHLQNHVVTFDDRAKSGIRRCPVDHIDPKGEIGPRRAEG